MKHAAMLRPFLAAMAAFFFSVSAFAQALPYTTPPLNDIWEAANDTKYGRTGTDPDADFGRDRMYRGTTPANDATFTRRGRSAVSKAAAGAALAKFARKFGPLSTVLAFAELADDLSAVWNNTPEGWELSRPVDETLYEGFNPRTGQFEFTGTREAVCGAIMGAYESYGDGPYTMSPSTTGCNLLRGTQNMSTSIRPISTSTSLQPFTPEQLAEQFRNSPWTPQALGEVDGSPQHDGLPALDPARLPWSPEIVVLPEPIIFPPRTSNNPDGSTTVTNRRLDPSSSATGPIFWTPIETTTTTMPDGSVKTGTSEGGPQASPEPAPFEMPCGVPGKLPCNVKVDETGVPDASSLDANKGKDAEQPLDDFLRNPTSIIPAFPTINWAFVLPTSCGVIPTPQFEPFFTSLDVCQFQPMFHDVMNVVWMLGGLFGAISLFMKSALAD